MAVDALRDPWARQKRAREHLRTLEEKYGLRGQLERHEVWPEMHDNGLEYGFYVIETAPALDSAATLLVSECLFNLRAALDHLVYQLHFRRFRGHVPLDAETDAQWPIVSNLRWRTDDTRTWREIKRLSAVQRAAIKRFQPYITRNDNLKDTRARLHALAILQNIDKHRRLHVTNRLPAPVSETDDFPPGKAPRQMIYYRPLVAGTEVKRWIFTEPPTEMRVHHHVWSQVCVDEPISDLRFYVHELLSWLVGDVDRILETFARRFWHDPEPWRHS